MYMEFRSNYLFTDRWTFFCPKIDAIKRQQKYPDITFKGLSGINPIYWVDGDNIKSRRSKNEIIIKCSFCDCSYRIHKEQKKW